MSTVQINTPPAGTIIDLESREHLETLIFGDHKTINDDKSELFARKSFLSLVEELLKNGDRKLVKF